MTLDTKNETFREFLERLRKENELTDIKRAVDIRHIATLVDQSDKALVFHNVIGYDTPVVSGIFRNQRRTALGMGCIRFSEIEEKLKRAIEQPIAGNDSVPSVAELPRDAAEFLRIQLPDGKRPAPTVHRHTSKAKSKE